MGWEADLVELPNWERSQAPGSLNSNNINQPCESQQTLSR